MASKIYLFSCFRKLASHSAATEFTISGSLVMNFSLVDDAIHGHSPPLNSLRQTIKRIFYRPSCLFYLRRKAHHWLLIALFHVLRCFVFFCFTANGTICRISRADIEWLSTRVWFKLFKSDSWDSIYINSTLDFIKHLGRVVCGKRSFPWNVTKAKFYSRRCHK